jgi:hypothetical protein
MSASNAFESDLLLLLFNNTNIANLGDATGVRGSTTAGSFFIALHTADPTEAGNQTSSEISYTGYARVAVARSSGGWTVSGTAPTQVANAATVTFGQMTAGAGGTATYFSVGRDTSGTGEIITSGALSAGLAISNGITPSFAAGALVVTFD